MEFYTPNQLIKFIKSNIDEAEIFAYYLDTSITEVYKCINNNSYRIYNTLRAEDNPSFGLKYISVNGKIKLYGKDFANPIYTGDCFHIAGLKLGLNCNSSIDFVAICKHIIYHVIKGDIKDKIISRVEKPDPKVVNTIKAIDVEIRDYNKSDLVYWKQYGIKLDTVIEEKVYAVSKFFIDGILQDYQYTEDNPAYGYYLGINKHKLWEVYRPFEQTGKYTKKFRTNNVSDIKELYTIRKHKNLILTKSKKDKLLIVQLLKEFDINDTQVLYTSESSRIRPSSRTLLNENYKNVFINFDLDPAGIKSMKYFNMEYGYKLFPIATDYLIKSINNYPKDLTDFCKRFGYKQTIILFNYLYNEYIK